MCKPKGINRKKLVPFVLPITFTHFWEKVWTGSRCELLMLTLDVNTKTLLPVSDLPCILSLIQ